MLLALNVECLIALFGSLKAKKKHFFLSLLTKKYKAKEKKLRDNEHPCGFTKAQQAKGEENSQDEIQQVTKAEGIFR